MDPHICICQMESLLGSMGAFEEGKEDWAVHGRGGIILQCELHPDGQIEVQSLAYFHATKVQIWMRFYRTSSLLESMMTTSSHDFWPRRPVVEEDTGTGPRYGSAAKNTHTLQGAVSRWNPPLAEVDKIMHQRDHRQKIQLSVTDAKVPSIHKPNANTRK